MDPHRQQFGAEIVNLPEKDRRWWFSDDKIKQYIQKCVDLNNGQWKTAEDYKFLKRYQVVELGNVQKLARRERERDALFYKWSFYTKYFRDQKFS